MADSTVNVAVSGPRKTRMHRLIEEEGIVLMPGIYDALSAAVLQSLGFRAGFVSGYAVSASRLGMPDIGLLTYVSLPFCTTASHYVSLRPFLSWWNNHRPPEMADAARAICAAAPNVAFIVDAGHMQGKQHAAKIAAAREAIGDSDFFLIARTDARATVGADACFVEAPRSDDEMREVCKRTNGFRAANMLEGGYTPLHTPQELKELGFHLIVHSTTAVYASARALIDVLKVMKEEGTSRDQLHKLTTFEEFNSLIGLKKLNEIGARYDKFQVPSN
ncbi:hypothetical protein BHM03_00053034 [Ensete ventricosum]|nr:hypothetical protein BHM03_00053034 [Ensete ventricosum]